MLLGYACVVFHISLTLKITTPLLYSASSDSRYHNNILIKNITYITARCDFTSCETELSDGNALRQPQRLRLRHFRIDVFARLELLFPFDDLCQALDEEIAEVHLGHAETVGVGDVPRAASGGGVDARGAASL